MKKYDIIIIGGGVIGNSIARELSKYDLKIALLEKEAELAFGVSKSNSGIIHPGTQNSPDSLKGKLCVEGNKLMREIAIDLGVDLKEVGELIVIFDANDMPSLEKLKHEGETLGVPGLVIVDRLWLDENEPNLNKEAAAALYAPSAAIISPYRLVYDLSENAKKNGVEIFTLSEVTGINIISEKEERFELLCPDNKFKTKYVINAGGLYSDKISQMVGLNYFQITPRKGEEYILDKKREYITKHLIFPLPTATSKGTLIIKTSDGNPMIGPTALENHEKEDLSTTEAGRNAVVSAAKKMIPAIDSNDIIAYFSGQRPVSGKDFIIKHEDKVPGFINVAGIQSPGLTASPAIAKMVSDILRKTGLEMKKKEVFYQTRNKTKHLFSMSINDAEELIKNDKDYGDIVCRCEMVSKKEISEAIKRGAKTLDGIKFRTRAQAGRCHGGFCTTRIMRILSEELGVSMTKITKRGPGTEIIKEDRNDR
ncbi:MAG: NAD(P)/FAD-dependent oxidoreductase [Candidatus Omnitrophica bacterium]|nr:NAD(P)/FAD-dependent oxidoreductase [Candidatus Omnitrophota bacterium]